MTDENREPDTINPYDLTPPFALPWAENSLAADCDSALGISSRNSRAELERQADTSDSRVANPSGYGIVLHPGFHAEESGNGSR